MVEIIKEGDEEISGVFHHSPIIPSRQQVLFYLSSSSSFHVMRADREIQVGCLKGRRVEVFLVLSSVQ